MERFAILNLNHWRGKVKTFASDIFSPPYLPSNFILFFLFTNITQFAVIFMNYAPSYWHSSLREIGVAPTDVYEVSPTYWLLFGTAYLSIALLCLTVFNYRWSIIGWFTAEVIHFWGTASWLKECNFNRWSIARTFCESFDEKIYWVIVAALLGFVFTANLNPGGYPLPEKKLEKRISLAAIFFSAAWSFILLVSMIASAQKPSTGWIQLAMERVPPPLDNAAYTYDTTRNRLILFGGAADYINDQWIYKNETWEWNGKVWLNVSPLLKDSPTARSNAGMAYDPKRNVTVLYGGNGSGGALCDTWEWDGEKWINKCPPKCPGARASHEMYYDPIREKIVLYGGYDSKTFFNDAWEWDGSTWTQIELDDDAPVASGYALEYDPKENLALTLLSGNPDGTWTFKDNHWTHLPSSINPSMRTGTGLAYDPQKNIFVAFGGYANELSLNDTWLFDGTNWKPFTGTQQPPVRANMVMWYDKVRQHVMLFGGYNYNNIVFYNDMWELVLPEK